MINYIEKGIGLHEAIGDAGYRLQQINGVWVSDNDIAVQLIIDAYNHLPDVKINKLDELKAEGLVRIQLIFPAIGNWDVLDLEYERWLSIVPAARQPPPNYQSMIDIYQTGRNAAQIINARSDVANVQAYNVLTDPIWP